MAVNPSDDHANGMCIHDNSGHASNGLNNGSLINMLQQEVSRAVNAAEKILVAAAEMEILKRKEFLTEKDVSLLYSISLASLQTDRSRGLGPTYIKDGRRVLYSKKELDAYFGKRTIKTRS